MAKLVGTTGVIYSFEPANHTAGVLLQSLQLNNFKNVVVIKKGLSRKIGVAALSINTNSELNSLILDGTHMESSELVEITTLDECLRLSNWGEIDFIKIDAEGEEENIIQGGLDFFNLKSPLVMFEIKVAYKVNLDLISKFVSLGYKIFRLIPGLGILVPWGKNEIADDYLLNLFCCKSDRARILSDLGFLIQDQVLDSPISDLTNFAHEKNLDEISLDSLSLFNLPYTKQFHEVWKSNLSGLNPFLSRSLILFQESKIAKSNREKYLCLILAFNSINSLCKLDSSNLRLSTLARIAKALGYRKVAVDALNALIGDIRSTGKIWVGEPFLLPDEEFEAIDPKDQTINFIWSALLSSLEKAENFSSFFSGDASLDRLNEILETGFSSDEITRRRDLIMRRYCS